MTWYGIVVFLLYLKKKMIITTMVEGGFDP